MSVNLTGRTALVTGAASGFGRTIALGLLEAGARVALTDISEAHLKGVSEEVRQYGGQAIILVADLGDPSDVRRLIASAVDRLEHIEILVNNAGMTSGAIRRDFVTNPIRFWEVTEEQSQKFFEVNAIAPFTIAASLVLEMMRRKWGRIINVTTSLDNMLRPGMVGYGGSKAALEAHTAIMAGDLSGTGVTANVLVPGGPANTAAVPLEAGFDRAQLIQPEAMVPPTLWLCSKDADMVTGKRFLAVKWDPNLPSEQAAANSSAPVAWAGLGSQAVFPQGYVQKI